MFGFYNSKSVSYCPERKDAKKMKGYLERPTAFWYTPTGNSRSCSWNRLCGILGSPHTSPSRKESLHFANLNVRVREAVRIAHGHSADARVQTENQVPLSRPWCPLPLTLLSHPAFPPSISKAVPRPMSPSKHFTEEKG